MKTTTPTRTRKRFFNRVTPAQAFERGKRAAYQRVSRSACPYADATAAKEWERGYDEAKTGVKTR